MCTGDNIDTATAISLNAGIISKEDLNQGVDEEGKKKNYVCMTGKEFREAVGGLNTKLEYDNEGKIKS